MSSSVERTDPRATDVEVTEDELRLTLADGRRISAPLVWYPRLLNATPAQRQRWELVGDGQGVHWPDVDEDLSVAGVLAGTPSLESGSRLPAG